MANSTANYGLHQWEPGDSFLRMDFNEDHAKIDAAIKGVETGLSQQMAAKAELRAGSYTGNGAASRTISLGFAPKAVLVEEATGTRLQNGFSHGGLAVTGSPAARDGKALVSIAANGFQVYYEAGTATTNAKGETYHYLAFC